MPEMGNIKNYQSTAILEQNTERQETIINNNGEEKEKPKDASSSLFSRLAAKCKKYNGLFGIILAALSGIFVTLRSVSVKFMTDLKPIEVFLIRSIIQLMFLIPTMLIMKADPRGPEGTRLLLFLQGLAGSLSAMLQFISFTRLPVGEAATIFFSSPVIVMILSHCFLKENCTVYQIVLVFFFLIGVSLIALPVTFFSDLLISLGIGKEGNIATSKPVDIIGLLAAIVGTIFNAFNVIWMRKLKEINPVIILFSYTVTGLVASSIPTLIWMPTKLPPTMDFAYTLLVTLYGVTSRLLLSFALQLETAGLVAMIYSLAYEVMSFSLQIIWFKQIPEPTRMAGAGLVVISVMAMTMEKYIMKIFNCGRAKQEDDNNSLISN